MRGPTVGAGMGAGQRAHLLEDVDFEFDLLLLLLRAQASSVYCTCTPVLRVRREAGVATGEWRHEPVVSLPIARAVNTIGRHNRRTRVHSTHARTRTCGTVARRKRAQKHSAGCEAAGGAGPQRFRMQCGRGAANSDDASKNRRSSPARRRNQRHRSQRGRTHANRTRLTLTYRYTEESSRRWLSELTHVLKYLI